MLQAIPRTLAETGHHGANKPWGDAIAASFIVQLVTFSGIFLFWGAKCVDRLRKRHDTTLWNFLQQSVIPSFAGGALLATCVFLLVPESFELLGGGHAEEHHAEEETTGNVTRVLRLLEEEAHEGNSEAQISWKFGASVLGGFLLPILLGAIFPPSSTDCDECETCAKERLRQESVLSAAALETGVLEGDKIEDGKPEPQRANSVHRTYDLNCDVGDCDHCHDHRVDEEEVKPDDDTSDIIPPPPSSSRGSHGQNLPLACSILLGDAFHNFTDGIFIGNAFLLCDRSLAYAITASTIYHELAQEIADFALLTHHCGLSMFWALTANFLSGFSTMIGAIVILSIDVSAEATGAILAVSAGVYLYIAAVECIPRIIGNRKTPKDTLYFMLFFILGAVPIGLVLLNHGHCEAGHEDEETAHRLLRMI